MSILIEELETPTLTKAELVEKLVDQIGLNSREAKDMTDAFFSAISEELIEGNEVKLTGFGVFDSRAKAQRPGRNPRTGETVTIKSRKVVSFHASNSLKEQLQK